MTTVDVITNTVSVISNVHVLLHHPVMCQHIVDTLHVYCYNNV